MIMKPIDPIVLCERNFDNTVVRTNDMNVV